MGRNATMDKILQRKIEWLFQERVMILKKRVYSQEDIDNLLNDADTIIADETVDEEIAKQDLREQTKDTLGEEYDSDGMAGF